MPYFSLTYFVVLKTLLVSEATFNVLDIEELKKEAEEKDEAIDANSMFR